MTRLNSIQVLRAVAALGVVLIHCAGSWEHATSGVVWDAIHSGAYGVDLFFVISGFIICNTARGSVSAADFLRKRFLRVAPLYYVQTVPWLGMALATGKFVLPALATSLFFWPIWGQGATYPLLSVGWTLCFEALFYTSLAVVVRFGAKAAIALLSGYAVALLLNLHDAGGAFLFIGSPLLLEFLLGVAIAMSPRTQWPVAGLVAILTAAWLVEFRIAHGIGSTYAGLRVFEPSVACLRILVVGPPAFLLVWGTLQFEPWCKGRLVRAFSYLGDASYSIYLTHTLVVIGVEAAWRAAGAPEGYMSFAELPLAIGAGVLAYERLEKPLLSFLRRTTSPKPDPRQPGRDQPGVVGTLAEEARLWLREAP